MITDEGDDRAAVELERLQLVEDDAAVLFSLREMSALAKYYVNGTRAWTTVAQALPGRTGKQCRERWHNHLDNDIRKDAWSNEEDCKLLQLHTL